MLTSIKMLTNTRNAFLRIYVCVQIYHPPVKFGILTDKQLLWYAFNEDYKRATATACNPDNLTGPI